MEAHKYELTDLISLIIRNVRWIIGAILLTGAISALAVMIVPQYFRATTIFYSASSDVLNPHKILKGEEELSSYGTREEMHRLMTIGESSELHRMMVDSFDLIDRYGFKKGDDKSLFKAREKFDKLYDLVRSERDALELSIEDTDPEMAARMANTARDMIAAKAKELAFAGQQGIVDILQENVDEKIKLVAVLSDSFSHIRERYNIYNKQAQTEYYATEVPKTEAELAEWESRLSTMKAAPYFPQDSIVKAEAKVAGLREKYKILTRKGTEGFGLHSLQNGMDQYDQVGGAYFKELSQLTSTQMMLRQQYSAFESDASLVRVVEYADVPIIRHRPRRTLTVLLCMIGAGLLSILFLLGRHYWNLSLAHRVHSEV